MSDVFAVMRSVMLPDVRMLWPGTRLGRGVPPNRNVPDVTFWLTPSGKPLCSVVENVADQPPMNVESKQISGPSSPAAAAAGPKSFLERDKELEKTRVENREKAKKSEETARRAEENVER